VIPKGESNNVENYMSAFLRIHRDFPVQAKFKVGVIDSTGIEKFTRQFNHRFENNESWGWTKFACHHDLLKPVNALLNDDTLTLSFEVIFFIILPPSWDIS
jgi:hypothetical protein